MMQVIESPAEYADRFEMGALGGAVKSVAGIKGSAAVLHGVQGCTIEANHLRSGGPVVAGNYMPVLETPIGPIEVIQGRNEEMVMLAAQMVQRKGAVPAQLVFIFNTDATSIIEDDISRAASLASEQTGVPVIAIDTAAFLGGLSRGAEMTWCAILDRFGGDGRGEKRGINVVGPQLTGSNNWPNDIMEIERLLKAADVKLNHVLFRNITVDQLPEISRAKANYIFCGEDFADFDEKAEDLGMKNWGQDLVLPVGIHNTEEWYLTIAREFGDEEKAQSQINADMEMIKGITKLNYNASWMLTGMYGKRASILGGAPFAAALARFLFYDLNIRPVVIGLLAETPEGLQRAERLLEPMADYLDFEVLENPTYYSFGQKAKQAKVNFTIGMNQEEHLMEGLGIPHCSLTGLYYMNHWDLIPWPYLGIRGSLYLIGELWRTVRRVLTQPRLWQMQGFQPQAPC